VARFDRIVVVTKATELESLRARFASRQAVEFFLRSRGQGIDLFENEARAFRASLESLLAALPPVPHAIVKRSELPAFLWRERDLAVAVGPDGLVINVAKYLDEQPVVGINPNPATIPGTLVRFGVKGLEGVFERLMDGDFAVSEIALAIARTNDGRSLFAVNDFLVGRLDPISARYRITVAGNTERQSSSGVLVSTAMGANAWLKSVLTGASRIAASLPGARRAGAAGDGHRDPEAMVRRLLDDFSWSDRRLVYAVREPFPTHFTAAGLVFGILDPGESVILESEMSEGGAIFSDGLVEDFVPFDAGATVSIASAQKRVRLIMEAPHVARLTGQARPIAGAHTSRAISFDRNRIRR
jgi:NAD kinase